MAKRDLSVTIAGVKFKSPLIIPSGILAKTNQYLKAVSQGAGGLATKSCSLKPKKGHPYPRIIKWEHGFLNAVGLENPGVKKEVANIKRLKKKIDIPIIASIFGPTVKDIGRVAAEISQAEPDFIEVNISCPHVDASVKGSFANNPKATRRIAQTIRKKTKIPLIIKLSPNVENISSVAQAAEDGGADVIAAINTVGPGMVINHKTAKPLLGNKIGGVSGPAIKPIAIRCVYEIYQRVKIPIIGMGGLTSTNDVIEMILAGASAVGIGSAIYSQGFGVFQKITSGLKKYLKENNYHSITDFRGQAHLSG